MSTSPIARRIEVLSQIPLFSAFNRDELEALAGRFVDVSYRRGDTVCAPGGGSASLSELARASVDTLQRHLEDVGLTVPVLRIGAAGDDVGEYLPAFNARLGELFRWVVLDLGDARAATAASDASDLLVRIVDQYEPAPAVRGGPRARTLHVVNLHNATSPAVAINQCEPFVIRDDEALRGLTAAAQAAHIRDHRRSPAAPARHRLAP